MTAIDVVILSIDRASDTIDAVRSVLAQERVEPRIWLIDQGSDNQNLGLLKNFIRNHENVYLKELSQNYGVPGGRNKGVKLCNVELVVGLDNDAVFKSKDSLFRVVSRFVEDEQLGALGFRIENFFSGKLDRSSWVYPRTLLSKANEPFLVTRFCGAGHAVRRSAFLEVGGYDESLFFYWEELDLAYKMINLGYKIAYDPKISILHKVSPEARVDWGVRRFYYLVRNIIYLDWKFYRSVVRMGMLISGYLVKGLYNGVLRQALRGAVDGVSMARQVQDDSAILNQTARDYIYNNDLRYRGKLINRLKHEVFDKLPVS
jgi:GT2 family glycosyltransferase